MQVARWWYKLQDGGASCKTVQVVEERKLQESAAVVMLVLAREQVCRGKRIGRWIPALLVRCAVPAEQQATCT